MNGRLPESVRDIALLVARIVLGVVLLAHGWQKLVIDGISMTRTQFEALGIPMAIASSSFVAFVEFAGGALLIIGALTPVVVLLHLVVMIGAAILVHASKGIFAVDGGWELVGIIASCELILAAHGAGRFSVDRLVGSRVGRTGRPAHAAEPLAIGRAEPPAPVVPEPVVDAEPVTAAFPARSMPVFPPRPAGPSIFGDQPPTGSLPEQTSSRLRRLPRPVAPLQGRVPPRRHEKQSTETTTDPGDR